MSCSAARSSWVTTSVGLDSTLTWARGDTKVDLSVSNDFGAAASGQEQQTLQSSLGVTQKLTNISPALTANVNLGYNIVSYSGPRVDDYWSSSVGLTYILGGGWSVAANYKFQNNASNNTGSSYQENTLGVTLSAKF